MAEDQDGRAYVLEPLDTSGVFLGLSALQCVLIGGGITLAVVMITARLPLPIAALPVVVAAGLSFGRAGGVPVWEWLPLGASWLWAGFTRGRRWAAPLPLWPTDQSEPPPLPPCLDGLEVIDIPWRQGPGFGAIHDKQRHTLTAIVPVRGGEFVLQAPGEQDRLVAGWGDVLSQFTASAGVAHIAWSEHVRPEGVHEHAEWLAEQQQGHPASEYAELLDIAATTAVSHRATVSLTVAREKLHRQRNGRQDTEDPLAHALAVALDSLVRGCQAAGLVTSHPLDPAGVHHLLRTRVDPTTRSGTGRLAERLGLVPAAAGPLAMDTHWAYVRLDGAFHRTYWIASWPRLNVPAPWLEPFLSSGKATRTVTVVFVPVSNYQSRRRIQRDLVKLESDATTKEDKGRRVDARHQRATQALLDREQELVAGYVEMAYVGLVSVAAPSEDELEDKTAAVEQLAREAGLDLRALDGRQDLAWAATLPFGLAPKTLFAS